MKCFEPFVKVLVIFIHISLETVHDIIHIIVYINDIVTQVIEHCHHLFHHWIVDGIVVFTGHTVKLIIFILIFYHLIPLSMC